VDECKALLHGGRWNEWNEWMYTRQGLTLVDFSAQLEPFLTQENAQHTLHTP